MFGLGFGEVLIILVLALVLLGPQRLPDVAKQLGKGLREFRKATQDLKQQFETEIYSTETLPAPNPSTSEPRSPDAPVATSPNQPAPAAASEDVPGPEAASREPAKTAETAPGAPELAVPAPASAEGHGKQA